MIRYFIRNGIAVSVLSMALLLFGVLALFSLPIQLTPDVSAPVLSVVTYYPGATPEDIEQDILIDQEQYLKSLPGLEKMISTASMGQAEIELEFGLETNQQENIVRINNALAQVPGYPENVDEPTIQTSRRRSSRWRGSACARALITRIRLMFRKCSTTWRTTSSHTSSA